MHQPTEVIPLVDAAKMQPVAQSDGYPLRDVGVVGDQERLAVPQADDETLVLRAVLAVVVRQQALDETRVFDPAAGIGFRIRWSHFALPVLPGQGTKAVPAIHGRRAPLFL